MNYSFFGSTLSAENLNFSWVNTAKNISDSSLIFLPDIAASGVSIFDLIFGDDLTLSGLEFNKPEFKIIKSGDNPSSNNSSQKNSNKIGINFNEIYNSLSKLFPGRLKPLKINSITVNSGNYSKISGREKTITDQIKKIDINIKDFSIRSSPEKDSLELMFFSSIQTRLDDIQFSFPNSGYRLETKLLNISSKDSLIEINNFSFVPKSDLESFFALRKFRSDRWEVKINKLKLTGINFGNFVWNNLIKINKADLNAESVDILTNTRLPADPASAPKMPHEIVQNFGFDLNLKSFNINMDSILVKSLFHYHHDPSVLIFTRINADISNISNISKLQSVENPAVIKASAYLMNKNKLELLMHLPLLTDKMRFSYKGSINSMNADVLNPHLVISDLVKVTSGGLGSAEFSVKFKNDSADVYVRPIYSNLSIESVDEETLRESGIMEKISTFAANTFKLRKNNPDEERKVKEGRTVYTRKKDDAFLDVVWESLKKGLGNVIGF